MTSFLSHTAAVAAGAILATTGIAAAASQHVFTMHQGDFVQVPALDLLCDYVGKDHSVYCFRRSHPKGSAGVKFNSYRITVINDAHEFTTFPRNP